MNKKCEICVPYSSSYRNLYCYEDSCTSFNCKGCTHHMCASCDFPFLTSLCEKMSKSSGWNYRAEIKKSSILFIDPKKQGSMIEVRYCPIRDDVYEIYGKLAHVGIFRSSTNYKKLLRVLRGS